MATITSGDIALTTSFSFLDQPDPILATLDSRTQTTGYRRPVGFRSINPGDLYTYQAVDYGYLIKGSGDSGRGYLGITENDAGSTTFNLFDLYWDFLEIRQSHPDFEVSSWDFEIDVDASELDLGNTESATIKVYGIDNANVLSTQNITQTGRHTMSFSITQVVEGSGYVDIDTLDTMINGWNFRATLTGTAGVGIGTVKLHSIKARVNYTSKTDLKTGFVKRNSTVGDEVFTPGVDYNWKAQVTGFDFSDRFPADAGYNPQGMNLRFGANKPEDDTATATATSKNLKIPNSAVYIYNSTISDETNLIQDGNLGEATGAQNEWFSNNVNHTFAEKRDNVAGAANNQFALTHSDVTDSNLSLSINLSGSSNTNYYQTLAPSSYFEAGSYLGGYAEAELQFTYAEPVRAGNIAMSLNIAQSDTEANVAVQPTTTTISSQITVTDIADSTVFAFADVEALSFDTDLENTGLAGLVRTGFTVDPSTSFTITDLVDQEYLLIRTPPAAQVFTTTGYTRTLLIPLQGEDRAHERTLYIDQQTRVLKIPIQGEDRAHERHLYIDQQTRTIKSEALEE